MVQANTYPSGATMYGGTRIHSYITAATRSVTVFIQEDTCYDAKSGTPSPQSAVHRPLTTSPLSTALTLSSSTAPDHTAPVHTAPVHTALTLSLLVRRVPHRHRADRDVGRDRPLGRRRHPPNTRGLPRDFPHP